MWSIENAAFQQKKIDFYTTQMFNLAFAIMQNTIKYIYIHLCNAQQKLERNPLKKHVLYVVGMYTSISTFHIFYQYQKQFSKFHK